VRHRPYGDDTDVESLQGQLLVAGPGLVDPNFWRTVVLVGEHSDEGALGIVLNRSSETKVEEALPELALLADDMGAVHVGGPVQPSAVVVLADFADVDAAESLVMESVGFLQAEVDPEDIGELRRARVFVGYAGWGPGQLDGELDEGSWIVEPAIADDVFTSDPDGLWSDVLRRKGGPFAVLAAMPPDPSQN
jgi:putative transcriptional regulator